MPMPVTLKPKVPLAQTTHQQGGILHGKHHPSGIVVQGPKSHLPVPFAQFVSLCVQDDEPTANYLGHLMGFIDGVFKKNGADAPTGPLKIPSHGNSAEKKARMSHARLAVAHLP